MMYCKENVICFMYVNNSYFPHVVQLVMYITLAFILVLSMYISTLFVCNTFLCH